MLKGKLFKLASVFTIFFFIWFCVSADFSFAQTQDEDPLQKAKKLSQHGDYDGAIQILRDYIEKLKLIKEQKQNLATAYYSLARTYYKVGEEELCNENLMMVFKTYPSFSTEERDFIFQEKVEKIKKEIETEVSKEESEKVEKKVGIDAKVKDEQKPVIKKEIPQKKAAKKIILKPIKKKKKKKFPWLLAVGGVVVVGILLYLLFKKKDSADDSQNNYDTEVLGIEWINIPAGEFQMGDNFNEGYPNEKPVHAVYLDSYKISKFEVTFDQFDNYCEETNRILPDDKGWGRINRPVINVSWIDASSFCLWLSEKTGKNIHLPTEAQWEKAARGTNQSRFPWGNSAPDCSKVNYSPCDDKTKPVGSYPSGVSEYGIYDLAGNVWEWCSDWYSSTYYYVSPYNNPSGPSGGYSRVLRGGGWNSGASGIRSAIRYYPDPYHTSSAIGFRICQE